MLLVLFCSFCSFSCSGVVVVARRVAEGGRMSENADPPLPATHWHPRPARLPTTRSQPRARPTRLCSTHPTAHGRSRRPCPHEAESRASSSRLRPSRTLQQAQRTSSAVPACSCRRARGPNCERRPLRPLQCVSTPTDATTTDPAPARQGRRRPHVAKRQFCSGACGCRLNLLTQFPRYGLAAPALLAPSQRPAQRTPRAPSACLCRRVCGPQDAQRLLRQSLRMRREQAQHQLRAGNEPG